MGLAVAATKRPLIDLDMAISLNNRLSTQVSLTPQLQQAIRLLQLSNNELEQELAKAAEDNPLLEFEPNPEIESNLNPSNDRNEVTQNNWSNTGNASQDLFKDMAIGVGVGAIWNSPIGPVRIYLAKGKSDFGSTRYFHLSMGPAL